MRFNPIERVCSLISGRWIFLAIATSLWGATDDRPASYTNLQGIKMVLIRAGEFQMGNDLPTDPAVLKQSPVFTNGLYDERPVHLVRITYDFYISETEITASQFARFHEDHEEAGMFSPYATGVSWDDGVGYCKWLSEVEGKNYRLPTEAEWEYVARAGSSDHFSSGPTPPASGAANGWGVKNMHTDASEWVLDWYDVYRDGPQIDPVGPSSGIGRVVRGGGLNMKYHTDSKNKYPNDGRLPFFRRSANRACVAPQFSGRHNIGFRIVQAALPRTPLYEPAPKPAAQFVRQSNPWVAIGPDPRRPWFRQRDLLPIPPENASETEIIASGLSPGINGKNHSPGLAVAPNGDLVAVYNSISNPSYEDLTNVCVIGARLKFGADQWEMPGPFFDFAGTKDIDPLITLDRGRLFFACGGGGLDGVIFRWQTSDDNGVTWGPVHFPVLMGPRGPYYPQPISNILRGIDGTLYFPTQGVMERASLLWASKDEGVTWTDTGGRTGGQDTAFVMLADGSIFGLGGKSHNSGGYMPKSISHDGGRTWTISETPFPRVGPTRQKPTIIRLASGRLFVASDWLDHEGHQPPGLNRVGAFVALSDDGGEKWMIKSLPGVLPQDEWIFRGREGYKPSVLKDGTLGYTIAAQGPNGVINIITCRNYPAQHFELNEAWILDPQAGKPAAAPFEPVGPSLSTSETYPDGKLKAAWSVQRNSSGGAMLNGLESHWYSNGAKLYEVTWSNGTKRGLETWWDASGNPVWQWQHREDGISIWTHFWANGQKRRESMWRGKRCDGPARAWDMTGKLIEEHLFHEGAMTR